MSKILTFLVVILTTSIFATDIYLAGDSTIASYAAYYKPLSGWGVGLQQYCKSGVKVINYGLSGSTTSSFRDRGNWDKIMKQAKAGDYVIIQFGHNDQKLNEPTGNDYKDKYPANLQRFLDEAKAKKLNVVFVTSIVRRNLDAKTGKLKWRYPLRHYADTTIKVAKKNNVPCVDLNLLTKNLVEKLGDAESQKLYNHLKPGEAKAWPKGNNDNTHLNTKGATTFAKLFVDDAKKQKLPICSLLK